MNWQSRSRSQAGGPGPGARVPTPAPREPGLPIGEACQQVGISARTLRYYEELGLLPGVRRRAGGRRVYGPEQLERLRFIQRLKALGLSLEEIRALGEVHAIAGSTAAMLEQLDEMLIRRLASVDGRLAELAGLRDEIEKYRARIAGRLGVLRSRQEKPR